MPPQPHYDISQIDPNKVQVDQDGIYSICPHRYEFMLLDGIYKYAPQEGLIIGYRECKQEEFWVRGHIPGRPLFPGVLMIETAAQLVSYYVMAKEKEHDGFLGFGGVDGVKFRGAVVPGDRLVMVGKMISERSRRYVGDVQGFVGETMVFEGRITGMWV